MVSQASLAVNYGDPNARVVIVTEAGIRFDGKIPIRVYPANPDYIFATPTQFANPLLGDGNRDDFVEHEILTFEKTTETQTELPGATTLAVTQDSGFTIDKDGAPITGVTYALADVYGTVRTEKDNQRILVTSTVEASYNVSYSRYLYTPPVEIINGVETKILGQVVAVKDGAIGKLSFKGNILVDDNYVEAYRVQSEIVADEDGPWEKPPNFPEDNVYPNLQTSEGPDTESYHIDRRIHEVGYVNRDGHTDIKTFAKIFEKPFFGSRTYRPEWTFKQNSAPEGYEDAFNDIDFAEAKAEAATRFPGLE